MASMTDDRDKYTRCRTRRRQASRPSVCVRAHSVVPRHPPARARLWSVGGAHAAGEDRIMNQIGTGPTDGRNSEIKYNFASARRACKDRNAQMHSWFIRSRSRRTLDRRRYRYRFLRMYIPTVGQVPLTDRRDRRTHRHQRTPTPRRRRDHPPTHARRRRTARRTENRRTCRFDLIQKIDYDRLRI